MTIDEAKNMVAKFRWQVILCSKHREYGGIDAMLKMAKFVGYPLYEWNERVYVTKSSDCIGTCEELELF